MRVSMYVYGYVNRYVYVCMYICIVKRRKLKKNTYKWMT